VDIADNSAAAVAADTLVEEPFLQSQIAVRLLNLPNTVKEDAAPQTLRDVPAPSTPASTTSEDEASLDSSFLDPNPDPNS